MFIADFIFYFQWINAIHMHGQIQTALHEFNGLWRFPAERGSRVIRAHEADESSPRTPRQHFFDATSLQPNPLEELDKLETWAALREFIFIVTADRTLKANLLTLFALLYYYCPMLVMAISDHLNDVQMQTQPNSYQLLWSMLFVPFPFSQYLTSVLILKEMWFDHCCNLDKLAAFYETQIHRSNMGATQDRFLNRQNSNCFLDEHAVSYVKALRSEIVLMDDTSPFLGLEVTRPVIAKIFVSSIGLSLYLLAPQMFKILKDIASFAAGASH